MSDATNEYFISINDVSARLSVPAHTLRYWEKQFPVAIRPTTGAGGRRYYRAETVRKLETIKALLYDRGMTIAGVKKMLREGSFPADAESVSAPLSAMSHTNADAAASLKEVDEVIKLLTQARNMLTDA